MNDQIQNESNEKLFSINSNSKITSRMLSSTKEIVPVIPVVPQQVSPISDRKVEIKRKDLKMTEEEKMANRKVLKNMSTKQNYVRNPRFRNNNKCLLYSNNLFKEILNPENPFVIDPKIVIFREFQLNCIYQIDLKVLNKTQILTSFKYIPPLTENFSIKRITYPKKDSSLIAPGMHAKIEILFTASSLNSLEDELTIIAENFAFKVPLRAIRDIPALSLDNPMDCGRCLLGDQSSILFRCKNNGGDAHFKFITVENSSNEGNSQDSINLMSTSHLQMNIENEVFNVGPFSIFPQEFYLYKGMPIEIFINFNPKQQGVIEKDLIICCDSKINLNYKIKGEGISIDMKLVSLDGLLLSETDGKLENLYFDDTYPYTISERTLKIINNSPVPVKFHWNVYEKDSVNKYSSEEEEIFFCIDPEEGTFQPQQEIAFKIIFNPKNSKIYEQKLDLVIEDVPFQAISKFPNNHHFKSLGHMNNFTKGEPFLLGSNSPYPSYPIFSFNLKGKGSVPFLEVDNNFIDFGTVFINQTVEKNFNVNNPKTGLINFKLKKLMQIIRPNKTNYQKINNFFIRSIGDFPKNSVLNCQNHLVKMHFDQQNIYKIDVDTPKDNFNILRNGLVSVVDEYFKNVIDYKNEKFSPVNSIYVNYLKIYTQRKNLIYVEFKENKTSEGFNKKQGNSSSSQNKLLGNKMKKSSRSSIPNLGNRKTLGHGFFKNALNIESEVEEKNIIHVEKENTASFNLKLKPTSLGSFKSSIIFEPEDGIPFSIEVKANVIGPKIKLDIPSIELGLFPISEIKTTNFRILNISPVPLKFLIKESRFKNVNFSNYEETGYKTEVEGVITEKKYRKKINNLKDFFNRSLDKMDLEIRDSHQLMFSTVSDIIEPHKDKTITVSFMSPYPKSFRDILEIMIEHSDSYYININADCEEAFGYLDTTLITSKEIFLTVPLNSHLKIINPTNIPLHFKWGEVNNEELKAVFHPKQGLVRPRSFQEIKCEFTFFSIRDVDILFKCFIDEMEVPIGVVIKGQVTGLDIEYEMSEDMLEQLISSRPAKTPMSLRKTNCFGFNSITRGSIFTENNKTMDKSLKSISLNNLKVNKPHHFSFKIKNVSGINTFFNIYSKKYFISNKINNYDTNKINYGSTYSLNNTINSSNKGSLKSNKKSLNKKLNKATIGHMLLSDSHEKINFTSEKGNEFNMLKNVEKESEIYLSNQKGVAIRIDQAKGNLDANSEVVINVSVFNESVGNFEDELVCEVKGLNPKTFPIDIKIRGNPLQLCPFISGVNYISDPPVMKMGHVLTNVNKIEKKLKLVNTGFNHLSINWKVYDYSDILKPKRDIFDIKILESRNNKFHLKFNPIQPLEIPDEKQSFHVVPKNSMIDPKSTKDFTVIFHAQYPGLNSALIVAHPKLEEKEDLYSIKMSELAIKVDAIGVIPELTVDKKKNFDGLYVYKFYCHSFGINPRPKKSVILINKQRINIIVKIQLEGPFKITKTEPVEATIGDMHFNIIPNSNLKLEVKFLAPNPLNEQEWPMKMIDEKYGKIKVFFENNEFSEYHLVGVLKRPRLRISTSGNESIEGSNVIDFGYVNCESSKRMSIFIINETEVETKWSIYSLKSKPKNYYGYGTLTKDEKEDMEKNDDPDVFIFNLTSGIVQGPSNQLIDIPKGPGIPKVFNKKNEEYNPVRVDILFRPNKNVFYKTRYRLVSETGNELDFILKGYGSYLEEHIQNTKILINK